MRAGGLIVLLSLLLGGCTSKVREDAAEARGFERRYRRAAQEHYWRIQQLQQPVATENQP